MAVVSENADYRTIESVVPGGVVTELIWKGQTGNRETNLLALRAGLQTMLNRNATYLAIAAPSLLQQTVQMERLTRQCSALARLLLDELSDISGT